MVAHIKTVAFLGVDAVAVDVQVHLAPGHNAFTVVGLPDKSVAESRERVRAALSAMGLALPYERITINLSPADLPKEGSHCDLPIALGLLVAMGGLTRDQVALFVAMGELALDGACTPVPGALPAAMPASRLPGILPTLTPQERLEISLIESLGAQCGDVRLAHQRPFRAPAPVSRAASFSQHGGSRRGWSPRASGRDFAGSQWRAVFG